MMQARVKNILFILLFVIIWLPLIQEFTKLFKEVKLKGAYYESAKPQFSIKDLRSFEFQKQYEKYQNDHFGFRNILVKIKNSLEYILFHELNVEDNVEGKNGMIFSKGSICHTLGLCYNGKEKNEETINRILFMRDGLRQHKVQVITILAPSKEMIFPDYLPAEYINQFKEQTDYRDIIMNLQKNNLSYLDLCTYFMKMKDTSKYPLFTKTGFHWSGYSSLFAQDSLLSYMKKFSDEPLPEYKRTGIELSDTARKSDADFEEPLNLLFSLKQKQYAYPKISMVPSTLNRHRPKVIIIGDSFFWQIKDQQCLKYVFSKDSKYWYYFGTTSFPIGDEQGVPLKDINIMDELQNADFVLLFGSMGTLDRFPFGVTDYYYDNFAKQSDMIIGISAYLKNHSEWSANSKPNSSSFNKLITEQAVKICRDKKTFQLKAPNAHYVCADGSKNGIIIADKTKASTWETFSLIPLGKDKFAISSYENRFLSAELKNKAEITANRKTIDDWEVFSVVELENGFVAIKAFNGKYISLDQTTGQLVAKSDTIGINEKFKLSILE